MKLTGKARQAAIVLLSLVLVVSLAMLATRLMDYQRGEEDYSEAGDLVALPDFSELPSPVLDRQPAETTPAPAGETPEDTPPEESAEPAPVYVDPYADALRAMDFTALQEVNSDVLGWILIPGTVISYPLLQGTDNDYYLTHTWKGGRSAVGAIFMECQCSSDLSGFNTIIYGHRMRNGSMFASLQNYKQRSWWSSHPCVYITNDSGTYKYDIFAAYEVSVGGDTYRLGFSSDESKQNFIDYCLEQSVIDTGIVPQTYERILTLSTCTGNGHATRWVVQAVLHCDPPAGPEEPAELDPPAGPEGPAELEPPAGQEPPEAPVEPAQPEEQDAPPVQTDTPGEPAQPDGPEAPDPEEEAPSAPGGVEDSPASPSPETAGL